MLPKTEKELEIYFKLKELEFAYLNHLKSFEIGSVLALSEYYELEYQRVKEEYLKLVNEL